MVKIAAVAVVAMLCGTVLGFAVCNAAMKRLRRRVKKLQAQIRGEKPKKMGVMDKVLVLEAIVLILYTVAVLVIFWHTGAEPATLTGCVFGVCGLENGVMGWIKTNKDKLNAEPGEPGAPGDGATPDQEEPPDVGL